MRWLRDESGLTVIELLIALAILSLAVVTLTSAFSFSQQIFQNLTDADYQLDDIVLTRRLLVDALSQLQRSAEKTNYFIGEPDHFSIFTLAPRILSPAGPINLKVESAPQGGLEISWRIEQAGPLLRRTVVPEYRVRFAYYGPLIGWATTWNEAPTGPSLLRLSLSSVRDDSSPLALTIPIRNIRPAICATRMSRKECGSG